MFSRELDNAQATNPWREWSPLFLNSLGTGVAKHYLKSGGCYRLFHSTVLVTAFVDKEGSIILLNVSANKNRILRNFLLGNLLATSYFKEV